MKRGAAHTLSAILNPTRLWSALLAGVYLTAGMVLITLSTCSPKTTQLDEVRALKALRVATLNSPTTYYMSASGPSGYEYELLKGLADHLGVTLDIVVARSPEEALEMAATGRVHLAAAALGVTEERRTEVRFTQPVLQVVPQLVYRAGKPKPARLADLKGRLRVPSKGLHAQWLQKAKTGDHPDLVWEESADEETEALLYRVVSGELDYTIADSSIVAITQRYYPQLRVAFPLQDSQDIAWAFSNLRDDSLREVTDQYLRGESKGLLAELQARYFGVTEQLDIASTVTLAQHVRTRLPPLRAAFEKAAAAHGFDWLMLAAIAYQESHWNPAAVSPTGVKGIMMLTQNTAKRMKIDDREDPEQSIAGGAAYFRLLLEELPKDIPEPDRTYQALAAYNLGLGHLLDVRGLARKLGRNPNRWLDIRNTLPLLTQSEWHVQLKYGYARGYEALSYVRNIRTYYDMLVWINSGAPASAAPQEEPEPILELPKLDKTLSNPLNINSPML